MTRSPIELSWTAKNVKPIVLIKSFHYATRKRIKLYRLLCWFYLCNWINWIMFYLLFIHFSLGRRSLLILWNMQNKIRMKSSLSIKIGSCWISFLSTSFRGGDLFSSCGICKKNRMKSAIWKKLNHIVSAFYPLLPQKEDLFSSFGMEYAENENGKSLLIKIVSAFIHFSLERRSLLILPDWNKSRRPT